MGIGRFGKIFRKIAEVIFEKRSIKMVEIKASIKKAANLKPLR